jgi:DNA-binding XRE family transcriptional regulator
MLVKMIPYNIFSNNYSTVVIKTLIFSGSLLNMGRERYDYELLKWTADRLKALREERGLSQETVYFHTNINIGRIEIGKSNISLTSLSILCKYFGISIEDFFKGISTEQAG